MSTQIKWMRWDGFYDLAGCLNRVFDPIDEEVIVRKKLKMLGFYDGSVNEGASPQLFSEAVKDFKVDQELVPALSRPSDACDDAFLQRLSTFDDQIITPAPAVAVPVGRPRSLSASRQFSDNVEALGLTLALPEEVGVSILSVPDDFDPFTECAGIRLYIRGIEQVRSLMLRIYRNYDAATDARDVPVERMVYQEILDRGEIMMLPGDGDGLQNVTPLAPEKAALLAVKRHFGTPYMQQAHAPYKFRAWVSTFDDAFDPYDVSDRPLWKRLAMGVDLFEPALEFQRRPVMPAFGPPRPDPTPTRSQLVDDQFDAGGGGDGAPATRPRSASQAWAEVNARHDRGEGPHSPWTRRNERGINLCGQACPTHDAAFHHENRAWNDDGTFIDDALVTQLILPDPIRMYRSLYKRAASVKDGNWPFPELRFCFEQIRRHINRIRARLCCGDLSREDPNVVTMINQVLDQVVGLIAGVEGRNYPYRDALRAANKFLHVWEWIVFHTITIHEINHYGVLQAVGSMKLTIRDQRNLRQVDPADQATHQADWVLCNDWIGGYKNGQGMAFPLPALFAGLDHCDCQACRRLDQILSHPEAVVVPSYQPLDVAFFVKVRQVPLFVLGIIDLPYLLADGHQYSPLMFFNHDLFHTIDDVHANPHAKPQLFRTLKARVQAIKGAHAGWFERRPGQMTIYEVWDENTRILRQGGGGLTPAEQEAYDILLFFLLHEPATLSVDAHFSPALPEMTSISNRLNDPQFMAKLLEKARDHFFGRLEPDVLAGFTRAAARLKKILPQLRDNP